MENNQSMDKFIDALLTKAERNGMHAVPISLSDEEMLNLIANPVKTLSELFNKVEEVEKSENPKENVKEKKDINPKAKILKYTDFFASKNMNVLDRHIIGLDIEGDVSHASVDTELTKYFDCVWMYIQDDDFDFVEYLKNTVISINGSIYEYDIVKTYKAYVEYKRNLELKKQEEYERNKEAKAAEYVELLTKLKQLETEFPDFKNL